MTIQELKQETEMFQVGYWDAFSKTDNFPVCPSPSQRIDYHRGFHVGHADFRSGR